MKVCAEPGCPELIPKGRGNRCTVRGHAQAAEKRRGSRQARGYDADHDRLRAEWVPIVATGTVRCANPDCLRPQDPLIHPGEPWDLGHTDDRTRYRGPEHVSCNRSSGGRAAHR